MSRVMSKWQCVAALIVIVVCGINTSFAGVLNGVTIAGYSSQTVESWVSSPAVNLVNGSGFDPVAGTVDDDWNNMWQAQNGDDASYWTPWVAFDLGSVVQLDTMKVWNYNRNNEYSWYDRYYAVRLGDVYVSTDTDAATATWTKVIDQHVFDFAPTYGTVYNFPDVLDMGGVDARLVKFVCTQTYMSQVGWGGKWNTGNAAGLSEVQFYGVPEPATMAVLGLGALLALRKKAGRD